MPAYLKFYELERSPFDADSQSKVVLGTKALRDALAAVRSGLDEGATRICVNGQAGLGKTSLARALPKLLDEQARVAVILHPSTSWNSIRSSIAKQWRVGEGGLARSNLLSFASESRLVVVVDQAETATTDILDHLDVLLSYRTEADEPVVQSVLFANLTAQPDAEPSPLIWWLDRIQTLELQFAPLPREGVGSYIQKHLKRAGWKAGALFSLEAAHAIHGYTGGIPGEVDRVCERLLSEAAGRNLLEIEADFVHEMLDEKAEEDSNSYDTFEELVMEDEFAGADEVEETCPESGPSLQETLERFASADSESREGDGATDGFARDDDDDHDSADRVEGIEVAAQDGPNREAGENDGDDFPDDPPEETFDLAVDPQTEAGATLSGAEIPTLELVDETHLDDAANEDTNAHADTSLAELEDYLSRPPSEDELRAIRANGYQPIVRTAAILAVALTVVGILIQWLGGDDGPYTQRTASGELMPALTDSVSNPTVFANPDGLSEDVRPPPTLARLRGPVTRGETRQAPDTARLDAQTDPPPRPATAQGKNVEFDESPAAPGTP
jgi:general secretion pathway protein A